MGNHRIPRLVLSIIVFLVLEEFLVQGPSCELAYGAPQVLINSWDGTEWTVLEDMWDRDDVPNLQSLGPLHRLTDNLECFPNFFSECPCQATCTKPQHAIMLTGKLADAHGVRNNKEGCYHPIPPGLTIYEDVLSINPTIKTAHIVTKPGNVGSTLFGHIVHVVDFFYEAHANPVRVTDRAIKLIAQWRAGGFLIFLHFRQPDAVGHNYYVDSSEYRDAIQENDRQLGRLMQALPAGAKVYVLSDHGFGCPNGRVHRCSPHTFIVSNDPTVTDMHMVDVANYILGNFAQENAE